MWWMLFPRWIWFFLGHVCVLRLHLRVRAMTVSKVVYSHAGMCPNEMNPNLWVDAMSTCMRECQSDQVRMVSVARAQRSVYVVFKLQSAVLLHLHLFIYTHYQSLTFSQCFVYVGVSFPYFHIIQSRLSTLYVRLWCQIFCKLHPSLLGKKKKKIHKPSWNL